MRVEKISWAGVLNEDFKSAAKFFSETLKLPLDQIYEDKSIAHFRWPSGELFEVFGPSNRERKGKYRHFHGPVLGFEVDDLAKAQEELAAKGTRFITEVEIWKNDASVMFLGPEEKVLQIQQSAQKSSENISKIIGLAGGGLGVRNFAQTVGFFSETMNMPVALQDNNSDLAQFHLPSSQVFEVFGPNNHLGKLSQFFSVTFAVDNVRQFQQELQAKGVEFIGEINVTSSGEAFVYLRGPDGYLYKLWQPV